MSLVLRTCFFPPSGKMFWYFMKFQPSAETDHLPKYLWSLGTTLLPTQDFWLDLQNCVAM